MPKHFISHHFLINISFIININLTSHAFFLFKICSSKASACSQNWVTILIIIIRLLLLYKIPAFTGHYLAFIYTVPGNHLPTFCVYRFLTSLLEEKYNYCIGLMISKYFSLCVDNILYIKPLYAFDSHI